MFGGFRVVDADQGVSCYARDLGEVVVVMAGFHADKAAAVDVKDEFGGGGEGGFWFGVVEAGFDFREDEGWERGWGGWCGTGDENVVADGEVAAVWVGG